MFRGGLFTHHFLVEVTEKVGGGGQIASAFFHHCVSSANDSILTSLAAESLSLSRLLQQEGWRAAGNVRACVCERELLLGGWGVMMDGRRMERRD